MLEESWIVNILIHWLIFCWDFHHLSEFTKEKLKGQNDCWQITAEMDSHSLLYKYTRLLLVLGAYFNRLHDKKYNF